MRTSSRIQYAIAAAALIALMMPAQTVQAATFWDWLWGRSPYYRPQVAQTYRAPNGYWTSSPWMGAVASPAASPAAATYAAPVQPAITMPTGAVAQSGWDPCAQVAVQSTAMPATSGCCQPVTNYATPTYSYRPWPVYRNSWYRVPVTTYRPVPTINPMTNAAISQLQPCNSYTYRVQRVPVRAYRPLFSFWNQRPAMTVPSFFSPTTIAPCGTCSPTTSVPVPSTPFSNSGQPRGFPGALSPFPNSTPIPSNSSEPASQPPSLNPGEGRPQPVQPTASFGPSLSQKPVTAAPSTPSPVGSGVVPIPDPAARSLAEPGRINAPPLLGPRDHTAHYRPSVRAVTNIVWNVPAEHTIEAPVGERRAKDAKWDDKGWESVAR